MFGFLFGLVIAFLSFYLWLLITPLGSSAFSCNFSIIFPFVYYSFNIKCVCLDDDSLGSKPQSCPLVGMRWIGDALSMGSVIVRLNSDNRAWTIVFKKSTTLSTRWKPLFEDCEKEYMHCSRCKTLNSRPYPTLQWQSKVVPVVLIYPSLFLYVLLDVVLNLHTIFAAGHEATTQSI